MSIPSTTLPRRRIPRLVTLVLAFALAEHAESSPEPGYPAIAGIDLRAACPPGRWIGVLETPASGAQPTTSAGEPCPEPADARSSLRPPLRCPGGWRWLFASGREPTPPPGLQRFCTPAGDGARRNPRAQWRRIERGRLLYEAPRPELPSHGPAVPEHPRFERIAPVCRVVGPAAPSFFPWQGFADRLQARFDRQAGALQRPLAPAAQPVRLVIIDSVRDDAESPEDERCEPAALGDRECSPHGWALARLARRLLCDGAGCAADVDARRTLHDTYRIQAPGSAPVEERLAIGEPGGGLYGDWDDLALAIRREVAGWWGTSPRPRLILNLSVGWESRYGDAPAVRAAIEDAVCRGALVVAAAGNRVAGPAFLETPLLPAAWEAIPAPSVQECAALLEVPPPDVPTATSYRPLVHAVGGVQRDDRPLSSSRPNATPRLVAFGDHAPVRDGHRVPVTLTGTSVSTVVASAAAALRWRAQPGLSAFDVMAALWDTGKDLGRSADFCLGSAESCPTVKRVFADPPASFLTAPWPAGERPLPRTDSADLGTLLEASEFATLAALPGCDPQAFRFGEAPAGGAVLCPQRELFDVAAQPWLGPQPGSNHNPNCTYSAGSPGVLLLEFDRCFRVRGLPVRLADLTLVVGDTSFRLRNLDFVTGDPNLPCPSDPEEPRRVQVAVSDLLYDDPYPIYLTVSIDGVNAAVAPILYLRHVD